MQDQLFRVWTWLVSRGAEYWTAWGTWAFFLAGAAAAWLAAGTLRQLKRQTDVLTDEVKKMDAQTAAVAEQAKIMRDQFEAERAIAVDYEFVAAGAISIPLNAPRRPDTQYLQIPHNFIRIWNHGPHMVHVVGFEFTAPVGPGTVRPVSLAIAPQERGDLDVIPPLIDLIGGDGLAEILIRLRHLQSKYFESTLHCVGFGGRTHGVAIAFQATWMEDGDGTRIHLTRVSRAQPQTQAATG